MPTDLTERLAAKLEKMAQWDGDHPYIYLGDAIDWFPLLLSEPELVASLPDEVRLSVLTPRERAVMKLGEVSWAMQVAADAYVLSDADESGPEWDAVVDSQGPLNAATAEVAALTPEGKEPNAETARAIEEGRQGINVTEGLPDGE